MRPSWSRRANPIRLGDKDNECGVADILFVHQNAPAQFRHLAPALAAAQGHRVVFLTRRQGITLPNVHVMTYAAPRDVTPGTHHYLHTMEAAVLHGQQAARACMNLAKQDFRPALIVAHPGWGESLFIRDIFPKAVFLNYCEFYYHGHGADVGFDPEYPASLDTIMRARALNAHLLLALEDCDAGICPTKWQLSRHPSAYLPRIRQIFDGIDARLASPAAGSRFTLPNGAVLTGQHKVVTFVSRNLEPYRGFHSFMRALPGVLERAPDVQVVVVGGDEVSYGPPPPGFASWRAKLLAEVGGLDAQRVHFVGRVPHGTLLELFRLSTVNVYLTVPFVLSWSVLEAMACGCVVLGSDTAPVTEVISNGENGYLVDFFSPRDIADRIVELLQAGPDLDPVRTLARQTILNQYELSDCLARQLTYIREISGVTALK